MHSPRNVGKVCSWKKENVDVAAEGMESMLFRWKVRLETLKYNICATIAKVCKEKNAAAAAKVMHALFSECQIKFETLKWNM